MTYFAQLSIQFKLVSNTTIDDITMLVNKVEPETVPVPPTAHSPNSNLPVLVYRKALTNMTVDGALQAIETSEWPQGGHWKIAGESLAATPHYHSITHEAYTVLNGSGTYLLGKSPLDPEVDGDGRPVGVRFTARAGDVFVFPVGFARNRDLAW